jgi:paraquat-inducible protein B
VEFRGIRVGHVRDFDLSAAEGRQMLTRVRIALEPSRLGGGIAGGDAKALADALVAAGYRARLATGSLITGAMLVELLQDPSLPVEYRGRKDEPELPTVASSSQQLADLLLSLPRVVDNLEQLTGSLATLAAAPATQQATVQLAATLRQAADTLAAVQALVSEESSFQLRSAEAMDQLTASLRSFRELADMLERHPEAVLHGKDQP